MIRATARLLIVTAMAAGSASAQVQPPAAAPAAGTAGPPMGRLFFTPQQRATLDSERRALLAEGARPRAKARVEEPKVAAAPKPVARNYSLQGVVRRSDGSTTVWINNEAVHDRFAERDISPGSIAADGVDVRLGERKRRVQLRVGQRVDSGSGRVREAFEPRAAPVPPSPAGETRRPSGAAAGGAD